MLSDVLKELGGAIPETTLEAVAYGCLSPTHATQFKAFIKQSRSAHRLGRILKGDVPWPADPSDRDVLYFLAHSFRAQLAKELPDERNTSTSAQKGLTLLAKPG